jgi:hypothetical protein
MQADPRDTIAYYGESPPHANRFAGCRLLHDSIGSELFLGRKYTHWATLEMVTFRPRCSHCREVKVGETYLYRLTGIEKNTLLDTTKTLSHTIAFGVLGSSEEAACRSVNICATRFSPSFTVAPRHKPYFVFTLLHALHLIFYTTRKKFSSSCRQTPCIPSDRPRTRPPTLVPWLCPFPPLWVLDHSHLRPVRGQLSETESTLLPRLLARFPKGPLVSRSLNLLCLRRVF